jgi:hypothetical protein
MDSRLKKIFLGFPGPPQTRYTPSFLIFKKKLKFDGGYYTYFNVTAYSHYPTDLHVEQMTLFLFT